MTPRQERAKAEHDKFFPKLVAARDAAADLAKAVTVEDMLAAFRLLGAAGVTFLDEVIKDHEESYAEIMRSDL